MGLSRGNGLWKGAQGLYGGNAGLYGGTGGLVDPDDETPPADDSLDFQLTANSMYLPCIFEDI